MPTIEEIQAKINTAITEQSTIRETTQSAVNSANSAALSAAKAAYQYDKVVAKEQSYDSHISEQSIADIHVTTHEHSELRRLMAEFPDVSPDTPGTPEPPMPATAVSHSYIRSYFARNAQPGVSQAPDAVYVSRVPWARLDEESGSWVNLDSAINEAVTGTARKFMDNKNLRHECSTDTYEGVDDYNGKLWPFYWARCNFIIDQFGVKHITAIEGEVINGVQFDKTKNVGVFGPAFYFFNTLERWQNPETQQWTTADGTATGEPIFQLWGISARSWSDLSASRRSELEAHGVTEADVHLWPEAMQYDENGVEQLARPYWIHSAYCAGYEMDVTGVERIVSKPNVMPWWNMHYGRLYTFSSNNLAAFQSNRIGFGVLFDIVKNATKNTFSIHAGYYYSTAGTTPYLSAYTTVHNDYIFPLSASNASKFEVGMSVLLDQSTLPITNVGLVSKQDVTCQSARIKAIKDHTFLIYNGTGEEEEITSKCLFLDGATCRPFRVCTGVTSDEAIALTKSYTDQGEYACCYVKGLIPIPGETDSIIDKHDGSAISNTNKKHAHRVQGTEYTGSSITFTDIIQCRGDDVTAVTINGKTVIPTKANNTVLFQLTKNDTIDPTRWPKSSYSKLMISEAVEKGYTPLQVINIASGFSNGYQVNQTITNIALSSHGIYYPVSTGGSGTASTSGAASTLVVYDVNQPLINTLLYGYPGNGMTSIYSAAFNNSLFPVTTCL